MRPTFIYQTLKLKFKIRGLKLINLSRVSQYKCLFRNTQTTTQFTYLDQCPSIRPQVSGPFVCHLHAKPVYFNCPQNNKILWAYIPHLKSHFVLISGTTHMFLQGIPEEEIRSKAVGNQNAFHLYNRI